MFYESLIILNISTLNFSEGVPASVLLALCIKEDLVKCAIVCDKSWVILKYLLDTIL